MENGESKYNLKLEACSLWLATFLILVPVCLLSQPVAGEFPAETFTVCTDRTLYITGETINFSALVAMQDGMTGSISKILYAELIKPDGSRVNGGKYMIELQLAAGCLEIPEDIPSGYYYMKSYTRWMRNSSTDNYHYIRLKIINPYSSALSSDTHQQDTIIDGVTRRSGMSGQSSLTDTLGVLETDRLNYHPGEKISVRIDKSKITGNSSKLCLSVIPEMAYMHQAQSQKAGGAYSGDLYYMPETRGVSVSGRLMDNITGLPVPNALVNLSIIGDHDVMAYRTDGSGRFYFSLPGYNGSRDIFLCGEDLQDKTGQIYIDNDFCSRPVNLVSPLFNLSGEEKETAVKMAANRKISSVFYKDSLRETNLHNGFGLPFYGEPDEILQMDKYIDLPSIEDYFSELLGSVNIRNSGDRKVFRFNSPRAEMLIYDPLVLIDWVAVNDIKKILAMSPRQISRIELINAPYIKGNIIYGGIISFISKNNDFAGIDLPSSGTFVNYNFLEDCMTQVDFPDQMPAGMPDSRNTIYWDPGLEFNVAETVTINFLAPDTPGKYLILLQTLGDTTGNQVIIKSVAVNH